MPADDRLSDLTDDDGEELWSARHVGQYLASIGRPLRNPHVWISRAKLEHVELREVQRGYPVRLYRRDDVERAAAGFWSRRPPAPARTNDELLNTARRHGLTAAAPAVQLARVLRIGERRAARIRTLLAEQQTDHEEDQ